MRALGIHCIFVHKRTFSIDLNKTDKFDHVLYVFMREVSSESRLTSPSTTSTAPRVYILLTQVDWVRKHETSVINK